MTRPQSIALNGVPMTATSDAASPGTTPSGAALQASVVSIRPGVAVTSRRRPRALMDSDEGLATAEYAIATLAAVGFAALLVAVLSSGEIRGMLMSLISSALSFG